MWVFGCIRYTQCQITGLYAGLLALVIWKYSFYTSYTSKCISYDTVLNQTRTHLVQGFEITGTFLKSIENFVD